MSDLLVVGLGNPGDRYERTRHNVGVDVIYELAQRYGASFSKSRKDKALISTIRLGSNTLTLALPQTFMNCSGESVRPLVKKYVTEQTLEHLVVVHDELDLVPGRVKAKFGGGLAGHNGLRSIRDHLRTTDFTRVRVGIGRPPEYMSVSDWVLKRPNPDDRALISQAVSVASDAIESLVDSDIGTVMAATNGFVAES